MPVSIAVLVAVSHLPASSTSCVKPAEPIVTTSVIDGYRGDQLANAATINRAGMALGFEPAGLVLAVMTAMGESGLHDLPYGDNAVNPDGSIADSVGLFQQQHGWGSRTARMDPSVAATGFYRHLRQVPHWQTMTPTAAAHVVQGNADPDYYAPYYGPALDVVGQLTRTHKPCLAAQTQNEAGGAESPDGWSFTDTASEVRNNFLDGLTDQGATLATPPGAG